MRTKKKKYIKYRKERVILSDILPYEIPITFSNRNFYDFLLKCRLSLDDDGNLHIEKNNNHANQTIIKLLLGISNDKSFDSTGQIKFEEKDTIPFVYKIIHKENDFRELTIIHPKNQLFVINFYDKYKDLILYYCTKSQFSIRRPHKIAKYTYFKDRLHIEKLAELTDEIVEQNDLEYENLKTFFVYKKYSNIHKFYESYQYHRCEKKFNYLFKFDLSKCFDSIYTHSISWALLDKEVIKKYLTDKDNKRPFGSRFDILMQKLNYNETNGIIIGPEFSRIFAELILQEIDNKVKCELEELKYQYKKDYEVFRYVDDYFIFYNDDNIREKIHSIFRLNLRLFKLSLNEAKTIHYKKPIITGITIAKRKINELLNSSLCYHIEDDEEAIESKVVKVKYGKVYIDANKLITKFKIIVYESDIDYKDILNYTFAIIERKLSAIIKTYYEITHKKTTEKEFIKSLLELLDFIFFIYSVSPRVNTTIKLCRVLRLITETLKLNNKFSIDFKHLVFKKIYDNIVFTLNKNKTAKHTQVETLYLLIALGELGNRYWLTQDTLASYLCIEKEDLQFKTNTELNYFTIVVSLFYMKNKVRFNELRTFIFDEVLKKIKSVDYNTRIKKAELVLLLFDILTYPYIDIYDKKKELLALYKVESEELQSKIINARKHWFTTWSQFNFGKELDAKQGREVY